MTLADYIRDEEISISAPVAGDDTPGSTQEGVFVKLRDMDADNKTALEAAKTAFDAHDHSGAGKGAPLGKDGSGADIVSFSSGAFTATEIAAGAVTGAKIQNGSIDTAHIQDDTITEDKLGDAVAVTINISGSSTATWDAGLGYVPLFHIEGITTQEIATSGISGGQVTFTNQSVSDTSFTVVYRGG